MAIRTTKKELAIGTAPQEATLTGIKQVFHEEGKFKGEVKNYFIQTKEFQDLYLNYNNSNPDMMYELDNLMMQLAGEGAQYDDAKMDEIGEQYKGTVIMVCKKYSETYDPGNVCFNKNYDPSKVKASEEVCPF